MIERFKKPSRKVKIALGLLLLILMISFLLGSFKIFGWATGFRSSFVQETNYQETLPDGDLRTIRTVIEPGKTLWDWLDLLIVPVALALIAFWFNAQNQKAERQTTSDRNQEAALQTYLDRMTELLLKEKLRNSKPGDEVQTVARTRTLTILNSIKKERRSVVGRFLVEAALVSIKNGVEENATPIVSLSGANLEGADLRGANLQGADLVGADLGRAILVGAILRAANLGGANLRGAILWAAHLGGADLVGAHLEGADLGGAILGGADLRAANLGRAILVGADLRAANLGGAHLEGAHLRAANLRESTLPDNDEWTEGTDMSRFTNPKDEKLLI